MASISVFRSSLVELEIGKAKLNVSDVFVPQLLVCLFVCLLFVCLFFRHLKSTQLPTLGWFGNGMWGVSGGEGEGEGGA